MILRTTIVLLLAGALAALGQTLPASRTSSVSVNSAGTVVAPTNFWTQGVSGLTDSQSDAFAAKLEALRLFPVFVIPLNNSGNGPFTDFDLKASTDNFDSLVYWFNSAAAAWDSADLYPLIFIIRPDSTFRAWFRINPAQPISDQLMTGQETPLLVVVSPSKISGSTNWMFSGNTALKWTFRRKTAMSVETDSQGREVWHPIIPTEWRRQRPLP